MRVQARFVPKQHGTLRERVSGVGQVFTWEQMWEITEADGGPYVGQHAWLPVDADVGGWVPTEDLADLEPSL